MSSAIPESDATRIVLVRETFIGVSAVVLASLCAVVLCPPEQPVGRLLILSVTCWCAAAFLSRGWAVAATTVFSVAVFVKVLAADSAELGLYMAPWSFTPLFLVAVMCGVGYRFLRKSTDDEPTGSGY